MSTRPHNHVDVASYPYRDVVPVPTSHPLPETMEPSAVAMPKPLSSVQDDIWPISHFQDENLPSRSLSGSQVPHDTREWADIERDKRQRKPSATADKDQGAVCAMEGEVTKMRNESQVRPPKENQHWYDEIRTDDTRDTPYRERYPPLKESFDIPCPPMAHAKDVEPIAPISPNFQHIYEAQSRELSSLRGEHRVALEEKKKLANACVSLKLQYEERSKKLGAMRHERQAALAQRKAIDDAYTALMHQHEEQAKELDAVRHERQAALEQKQKVEEHYTALRQKYEAQSDGYNVLRNKHHALMATLEQRTAELQGVQKFLTTADKFSGSEVVNTLRRLNEEVQQSTTFMAEWAVESFMLEKSSTDQVTAQSIEQTRAFEALGMKFMQLLGTREHYSNPILVEIAFRAYLTYELYLIASPWSIGHEEQSHNMYMDAIYQRMRDAEGQAISGNWRALTRAYTVPGCVSDPELARNFGMAVILGFSDILLAAGCTAPRSDITSGLWSKFAEKVHHLVSLAGQINKIIGIGVVSEDFEVVVVLPDTVFDEKTMEDSFDNGDRVQGAEGYQKIVLCATELGLVQRMRVGTGAGQDGKPPELIVIKPKVTLSSVTDMIDE